MRLTKEQILAGEGGENHEFTDAEAFEIMADVATYLEQEHRWLKLMFEGNETVTGPMRDQWLVQADHFLHFLVDNFTTEQAIASMRWCIQKKKLPFDTQKMTAWQRFAAMYHPNMFDQEKAYIFNGDGEIVASGEYKHVRSQEADIKHAIKQFYMAHPDSLLANTLLSVVKRSNVT